MGTPLRPVVTLEARGAPHAADANLVRGIFSTATARSFTQSITDPGSGTFTIRYYEPGTSRQPSHDLALLDYTSTDVLLWAATDYGPACLFRGRVTDAQVQAQAGGDITVVVQLSDYKALLTQRLLLDPDTVRVLNSDLTQKGYQRNYTNADFASVLWDLIRITQARTSGTLGIAGSGVGVPTSPTTMTTTSAILQSTLTTSTCWTGGNGAVGVTIPSGRPWEIMVNADFGTAIAQMAAGDIGNYDFGSGPTASGGFEWAVEPDPATGSLKVSAWAKNTTDGRGRGLDQQWLLDYGGSVAGFSTDWSVAHFSTMVRVSVGAWTQQRTIDASSPLLGRWERALMLNNPFADTPLPKSSSTTQTYVQQTADKYAAQAFFEDTKIKNSYTVTLAPAIDPTNQLAMALGDTCRIQVPTLSGPSNELVRIIGRTIAPTDNGDVVVTLALNRLPIFTTGAAARTQQTLSNQVHQIVKHYGSSTY